MLLLRKHIEVVRVLAVVMAGTFLSACMTWQTQSLQPERFRSADSTQAMRLVLTGGDTLMVHSPVIAGDSLVGMQTRAGIAPDSLERVSIPLTAISQAEVQTDQGAMMAALVAVGLVFGAAIYAASNPCIGLCSGH